MKEQRIKFFEEKRSMLLASKWFGIGPGGVFDFESFVEFRHRQNLCERYTGLFQKPYLTLLQMILHSLSIDEVFVLETIGHALKETLQSGERELGFNPSSF